MRVQDIFLHAVEHGHSFLAHALFRAIQQKQISPADAVDQIDLTKIDLSESVAAQQQNILNIQAIHLFAIPFQNGFAMYLSHDVPSTLQEHLKLFKSNATRCINMTNKIDAEIYDAEIQQYISFAEIKKQTVSFPRFVCILPKK